MPTYVLSKPALMLFYVSDPQGAIAGRSLHTQEGSSSVSTMHSDNPDAPSPPAKKVWSSLSPF